MKVYIVFIEDKLKVFEDEDKALKYYSTLLAIDNRDIRLEEHDVIEGSYKIERGNKNEVKTRVD